MSVEQDEVILSLVHPFSMFVVGPSRSGKTTLILDLLEKRNGAHK
jgi:GTPase SAR1 family protein